MIEGGQDIAYEALNNAVYATKLVLLNANGRLEGNPLDTSLINMQGQNEGVKAQNFDILLDQVNQQNSALQEHCQPSDYQTYDPHANANCQGATVRMLGEVHEALLTLEEADVTYDMGVNGMGGIAKGFNQWRLNTVLDKAGTVQQKMENISSVVNRQ